MNNMELKEAITSLPEFILRDVAVKTVVEDKVFDEIGGVELSGKWVEAPEYRAVTEKSKTDVIATVSNHYKLVQFKDVFMPMLDKISNAEGSVAYYNGRANVLAFPSGDDTGVLMENSVNKTTAVRILFVKNVDGITYIVPKAGILRKIHMRNNIIQSIENFSELLEKVKEEWNTIIAKFTSTTVTQEEADEMAKAVLNRKSYIEKCNVPATNMWEMYKTLVDGLDAIKFRTEIARMRFVEKIAEMLKKRAFLEKL